MFIGVSGLVGTGKSTTAALVAARLGTEVYLENVDGLPAYKRWLLLGGCAYEAQVEFLQRAFELQRAASIKGGVQERTVQENYEIFVRFYFAKGVISKKEFCAITKMYVDMCKTVRPPDVLVHMTASIETIHHRMTRRGRWDDRLNFDWQPTDLSPYYDRLLDYWTWCPVIRIDTTAGDRDSVAEEVCRAVDALTCLSPGGPTEGPSKRA